MSVRFPRKPKPPWYRGTYHVRSRALVAAAAANPATPCGRCGLTLAEHPPHTTGTAPRWNAGHQDDHLLEQHRHDQAALDRWPLVAEVSTCNLTAGARKGNRLSRGLPAEDRPVTALEM